LPAGKHVRAAGGARRLGAVRDEGSRLAVTPINVWFEEEISGSDRSIVEHLRRYGDTSLAVAPEAAHDRRPCPRLIARRRAVEAHGLAVRRGYPQAAIV
jgi:hypothetical protein